MLDLNYYFECGDVGVFDDEIWDSYTAVEVDCGDGVMNNDAAVTAGVDERVSELAAVDDVFVVEALKDYDGDLEEFAGAAGDNAAGDNTVCFEDADGVGYIVAEFVALVVRNA